MTHILTLSNYLLSPIERLFNLSKSIFKSIERSQTIKAIAVTREHMMKYKTYRETYKELSRLSDRELKDIGLSRGEIHFVAMEAFVAEK